MMEGWNIRPIPSAAEENGGEVLDCISMPIAAGVAFKSDIHRTDKNGNLSNHPLPPLGIRESNKWKSDWFRPVSRRNILLDAPKTEPSKTVHLCGSCDPDGQVISKIRCVRERDAGTRKVFKKRCRPAATKNPEPTTRARSPGTGWNGSPECQVGSRTAGEVP